LTHVEIHTDGACKGNPGPGGWGVRLQSGQHVQELFGGELNTTNNRMEMTAVIEGLLALKRPCQVTIYLDSEYVRKGITEWIHGWKARGWRTAAKQPVKNADLWQKLDSVVSSSGHQSRLALGQGPQRRSGQRAGRRAGQLGCGKSLGPVKPAWPSLPCPPGARRRAVWQEGPAACGGMGCSLLHC